MKNEIIKIRINLPTQGSLVITKTHSDYNNPATEGNYYVAKWKDGHCELDDILVECSEIIEAINSFKKDIK